VRILNKFLMAGTMNKLTHTMKGINLSQAQ